MGCDGMDVVSRHGELVCLRQVTRVERLRRQGGSDPEADLALLVLSILRFKKETCDDTSTGGYKVWLTGVLFEMKIEDARSICMRAR